MQTRKKIDWVLERLLSVLMGLMVINVLWQVTSRFLLSSPSSFTDELARYLMIWLGILGAAYVSGRNKHVSIDILPKKFDEQTQWYLYGLVRILILLFGLAVMVMGGSRLVYITWVLDQNSPALGLPLAFVYAVIPLSGVLIVYYKLSDLIKMK